MFGRTRSLLYALVFLFSWTGFAEPKADAGQTAVPSLEEQLKSLDSANQAPTTVTNEKLYAVQTRYLPLKNKSEFSMGGALNHTPSSFLRTQQLHVGYRFHFSDRWSLGLAHAWVNNKLKADLETLKSKEGIVPLVPYAISRSDLMLEYHVFYGKFRWSAERVSYFDFYLGLGPGMVEQNTGTVGAGVGDLGFAFWLGRRGSARVGLKDYVYNETYPSGNVLTQNLHSHLDLGYLF